MSIILPLLQLSMMFLSTGLDSGVLTVSWYGRVIGLSRVCNGQLPRPLSPWAELTGSHLQREKGSERRIYCWVLTCTHSWCCFSPLGPSAIPKASKTTACQVVTAGFKQLLLQCYSEVPSHTSAYVCDHIKHIYWVGLRRCFCGCKRIMTIGAFGFGAFGRVKCGPALKQGKLVKRWMCLYTCTASAHHNG